MHKNLLLIVSLILQGEPLLALPSDQSLTSVTFRAEVRNGNIVIDATGNDLVKSQIDELLTAMATKKGKRPGSYEIKLEDYPKFLREKKSFEMLTSDGIKKIEISKVEVSEGCSNNTLTIVAKSLGDKTDKIGLAMINATIASNAKIRKIQNVADTNKMSQTIGKKAFEHFLAKLTLDERKSVKFHSEKIQLFAGKFGKNSEWIAWIDEEIKGAEIEPVADQHFSYAALFDRNGVEVESIQPAKRGLGSDFQSWRPLFAGDLDGDGIEEIIGEPYYYEGSSTIVYRFTGKMFTKEVVYSGGC